jgi:hypothetical protein
MVAHRLWPLFWQQLILITDVSIAIKNKPEMVYYSEGKRNWYQCSQEESAMIRSILRYTLILRISKKSLE